MNTDGSETRKAQVWFGITATVTIGPGFLHKAEVGGIVMPHLPLTNWLLRIGLPESLNRDMSFSHEFAHFRTAPALLIYMTALIVLFYATGHAGVGKILFLLISGLAAWEIMCEGLVIFEGAAAYRKAYDGVSRIPRLLFWATAGVFTASGWMVVLYR